MNNQALLAAETALAKQYGKIDGRPERHIFLCALSEKQKCCAREEGAQARAVDGRVFLHMGDEHLYRIDAVLGGAGS